MTSPNIYCARCQQFDFAAHDHEVSAPLVADQIAALQAEVRALAKQLHELEVSVQMVRR